MNIKKNQPNAKKSQMADEIKLNNNKIQKHLNYYLSQTIGLSCR